MVEISVVISKVLGGDNFAPLLFQAYLLSSPKKMRKKNYTVAVKRNQKSVRLHTNYPNSFFFFNNKSNSSVWKNQNK